MKLKIFTILFVSVLALSGCEKIKDALEIKDIKFSTPIEDVEVPFAGIEGFILSEIPPVTLNIDINEYIKKETNGAASLKNVKSAKLVGFKAIKVSSEPEADLTVFKDAELWIQAPNFEEVKIATVTGNTNPDEIVFEVDSDVELIDYLKAPKGDKKIILKKIKVGKSDLTKFILTLTPTWKVTIGL